MNAFLGAWSAAGAISHQTLMDEFHQARLMMFDEVYDRLRTRAAGNNRPLEAELREILVPV